MMMISRKTNYFNSSLVATVSTDVFDFYYTSEFISKSMISFVPQNSEVGGTAIVINIFKLIGEKLKNTKWQLKLSQWGSRSSVQSFSRVQLFVIPWTEIHQASLSITNSRSLFKLMSIASVLPSNHLILCHPLLLLPLIFPSIRVFSNESVLCIRWPKYWSCSFGISPSDVYSGLISFRMDWLDLLAVQGTLKCLLQHHSSKASILQCSAFFIVQLSHPYMTTGKTVALTRWTFVVKVMSKAEEEENQHQTPPWPLCWNSQLYFSSRIFINFRLLYWSLRLLLEDFKVFKGKICVLFIMNFVHTRLDTQLIFIKDNDVLDSMQWVQQHVLLA